VNVWLSVAERYFKRMTGPLHLHVYVVPLSSPLWVSSEHVQCTNQCPLSAKIGHGTTGVGANKLLNF
jgi:hypothetical protein